nr:hypothetical protein [Oscillospiraceae bacterium]
MKSENRTKTSLIFIITLIIAILVFGVSVVKTSVYNHQKHHAVFEGAALLSPSIEATGEVSAKALPRSS